MLPDDCTFESPCSIKWMSIEHSLRLGAFSYGVSGFYYAAEIGRYTSIGEQVQVGRGNHPTSWFSSSPIFYEQFSDIYNYVDRNEVKGVDITAVEAAGFIYEQPPSTTRKVYIGNDVWIGHGAFIAPGVTIGNGAVIGAHAVITKDVPPYAIVVGNSARIVRYRFSPEVIERLQKLRWWDFTLESLTRVPIDNIEKALDLIESRVANGMAELFHPQEISLKDLL